MAKKIRTNFKKEYKLFKACEKSDMFRPAMEMVHFMNNCAYMSDAHILAKVPLYSCMAVSEEESEKLNGFSIHWKDLKMVYGFDIIYIEKDEEGDRCWIKAKPNGSEISIELRRTGEVNPPNYDALLNGKREPKATELIGLRGERLARLSQVMNLPVTGLNLSGALGAIYIENPLDGSIGMLMPESVID